MNLHNETQSHREIECAVYRALQRTSAALYRAYVLRNHDDKTTQDRIEAIWTVLTIPGDWYAGMPMETPVATLYGRFIAQHHAYTVIHEDILKVDAEYAERFQTMDHAL